MNSATRNARLPELLAPFLQSPPGPPAVLTDVQLAQLSAYLDLLLRWNARTNLTSVRDPDNIVTRHFGESLFAARHLLPPAATLRAIDLGSGAGFPGLPMKIFAPGVSLTLIESNHKKATFLKEVARTIALTNVNVFSGRAEDFLSQADLVTFRAVERYEHALDAAVRMVLPGGRLGLLVGATQAAHTPQLLPSFSWQPPIPVPQSSGRMLILGTNPSE